MDAASIYEQIRACEMRIEEHEEEIAHLQGKIARLAEAKDHYQKKQAGFDDYMWRERTKIKQVQDSSRIRLADSFAEAMHSLCNGSSHTRAENAFTGIGKKLDAGKQRFEDEIHDHRRAIEDLRDEIAYLRSRLLSLA